MSRIWSSIKGEFKRSRSGSSHAALAAASTCDALATTQSTVDSGNSSTSALPTTAVLSGSFGLEDQPLPYPAEVVADHTAVEEKAPRGAKPSVVTILARTISSIKSNLIGRRSSSASGGSGSPVPMLHPREAADGEVRLTISAINIGNNSTTTTPPQQLRVGISGFDYEVGIGEDLPPRPPPQHRSHQAAEEEAQDKPFYLRIADSVPALAAGHLAAGVAFTLYIKVTESLSEPMRCAYYYFVGIDFFVGFFFWGVHASCGPSRKVGIVQVVLVGVGFSAIVVDASFVSFAAVSPNEFAVICGALLATALAAAFWIRRATRN